MPPTELTSYQFSDEESPLYEFSARDISSKMQFEIILTMEGITPETGNTIQVLKDKKTLLGTLALLLLNKTANYLVKELFITCHRYDYKSSHAR